MMIGILALQGAFYEHAEMLKSLDIKVKEIRSVEDFTTDSNNAADDDLQGLIIPGGESTAIAVIGESNGVFDKIREFISSGKPVWGTCAGLILLADHVVMQKSGGQSLVGGINIHVCRNFFGSQTSSCEIPLYIDINNNDNRRNNTTIKTKTKTKTIADDINWKKPFCGTFIRAPAILKTGENVQVLSKIKAKPCLTAAKTLLELKQQQQQNQQQHHPDEVRETLLEQDQTVSDDDNNDNNDKKIEVIVAARQNNILVTAFHPELTTDDRFHRYFIGMVDEN